MTTMEVVKMKKYVVNMTEEEFEAAFEKVAETDDERYFPRLADGKRYIYDGSGARYYLYDPENPAEDFSKEAEISKSDIIFNA